MPELRYAIRTKLGLLANGYADLEEAKKVARAFLLDRSRERLAEVVELAPGTVGGIGPVVAAAVRKSTAGPITWRDDRPATRGRKD